MQPHAALGGLGLILQGLQNGVIWCVLFVPECQPCLNQFLIKNGTIGEMDSGHVPSVLVYIGDICPHYLSETRLQYEFLSPITKVLLDLRRIYTVKPYLVLRRATQPCKRIAIRNTHNLEHDRA